MPTVSEALHNFLHARKTAANADLIDGWHIGMEVQCNVIAADGEPVAGRNSTWSNGSDTWHSIRIPKNAATDPTWEDYRIGFPFDLYAEGIGMTGWDWKARRSRWFGYDFDALTAHAQGVGIDDEQLAKVKRAASALPYVEVRRSTGGKGVHLYVYLDEAGIPTANHTEHAALARCVLGMMSAEVGFDFASAIDACGHVLWVWHRKMSAENHGLEIIKPATKRLSEADLPANWRDHIEAVKGRRVTDTPAAKASKPDVWDTLTTAYYAPHEADHDRTVDALRERGWVCTWDAEHECYRTHAAGLKEVFVALGLRGTFETLSTGRDKATPNCYLFRRPNGAFLVKRFGNPAEAPGWTPDENGHPCCLFNAEPAKPSEPAEPTSNLPIKVLTAEQLAAEDCNVPYWIDAIWACNDPGVVGGGKKTLKTTIILALLISLATGLPFLGRFAVNAICSVLMLSGESGFAVLKESLQRICKSMGIALADVKNFHLSEWLPSLDNPRDLSMLEKVIVASRDEEIRCLGPREFPRTTARRVFPRYSRGCLAPVCRAHGWNHREAVPHRRDCHETR